MTTSFLETISTPGAGVRSAPDGSGRRLSGYAVVWNSLSLDLGGFVEKVAPDAFRESLAGSAEIFALANHDPTKVLARRSVGTLRLSSDSYGLKFAFDAPATTLGSDTLADVKNRNVTGCSFRFGNALDSWDMVSGTAVRTVRSAVLKEITICAVGAYPAAGVEARAHGVRPEDAESARRYFADRLDRLDALGQRRPGTTPQTTTRVLLGWEAEAQMRAARLRLADVTEP